MEEEDNEDNEASGATHRVLQKSTGRMIGTASTYPEYLRCLGTMNTRLEHCDKLDISKDPRSRELSLGSDVRSRLKQDLLLSDSEETSDEESNNNMDDDEMRKQAMLIEEMIDESHNETSVTSSRCSSASNAPVNRNRLTVKLFYEEIEGQENVTKREKRKRQVRCKLCKKLLNVSNFGQHIKNIHEEGATTKCPHCEKFLMKSSLIGHIKDVHKKENGKCPHCDKVMNKGNLSRHIRNVHSSPAPISDSQTKLHQVEAPEELQQISRDPVPVRDNKEVPLGINSTQNGKISSYQAEITGGQGVQPQQREVASGSGGSCPPSDEAIAKSTIKHREDTRIKSPQCDELSLKEDEKTHHEKICEEVLDKSSSKSPARELNRKRKLKVQEEDHREDERIKSQHRDTKITKPSLKSGKRVFHNKLCNEPEPCREETTPKSSIIESMRSRFRPAMANITKEQLKNTSSKKVHLQPQKMTKRKEVEELVAKEEKTMEKSQSPAKKMLKFKCDSCAIEFKYSRTLMSHKKSCQSKSNEEGESGEKSPLKKMLRSSVKIPFKCDLCAMEFKYSRALMSHKKNCQYK